MVCTLLIGIFSVIGLSIFKGKTKEKQPKPTKKEADEGLNKVYAETIKLREEELKKQVSRANRYQKLYADSLGEEEEEVQEVAAADPKGHPATWEEISAAVKQYKPEYEKYLSNPAIKYYVMDKFEGMSLNEILKEIEPIIGVIKPQSKTSTAELQDSSSFA